MEKRTVEIARQGHACRVLMPEKIIASLVPELKELLKNQLDEGVTEIEFDLTKTEMLDSSGIGLLAATGNSMEKIQGTIRVVGVAPEIFRLLTMMRLVNRLNVSSREE